MLRIYGIKQCSTMQKAFAWLDARNIAYTFHDYKKAGVEAQTLRAWSDALGWQRLINTRGTTWRKLNDDQRAVSDAVAAIALMQAHTSLIKRPILEGEGVLLTGFDESAWADALKGFSHD
ncbi:MAG: ArsC family reductase [Candidatus Dactylopiibacterium sp.]|nr:ArsC family reductase [Candidatus Dactylopiibacterium sp.]